MFERMRAVRTFYKFGDVTDPAKGRFTRLPVILRLERKGEITEIMIVHTKSKFSTLRKPSQWEKKDTDAIISAVLARQKLSIEMNVIRMYIAYLLYLRKAEGVVVMGDMNDGVTRRICGAVRRRSATRRRFCSRSCGAGSMAAATKR